MNEEYIQKLEAENASLSKRVWDEGLLESQMMPRLNNLKIQFSWDMCGMTHDILSYDITLSHKLVNELSPNEKYLEIKKYSLNPDNKIILSIYQFAPMFRELREDLQGFYNIQLSDFSCQLIDIDPPWHPYHGIYFRERLTLPELIDFFQHRMTFDMKVKRSTRWGRFKQFLKGT